MRRLAWSIGVVLMLLLGAIGLVLAVVWISIATHPDPGNLTMNVFFVTAGWAVLMTIACALFWANRDPGTAGRHRARDLRDSDGGESSAGAM